MERILLTGANGFIGRHVLPRLADQYEVHAVARIPARGAALRTTWHAADLLDAAQTRRLVAAVRPHRLLHLAWYAEPGRFWDAPENFRWVRATMDLIEAFAAAGGRRAVLAGTCAEYEWGPEPCREDSTPLKPRSVYGRCKLATGTLAEAYGQSRGFSAAWARLFFLYGPGEQAERLVPSVIGALLRGEPALCTHGRQERDFLHVEDAASALARLLDGALEGAVNVSSGQTVRVADLVAAIAAQTGRPDLVRLGAREAGKDDAPMIAGDNARLRSTGWSPEWTLERGLADTVGWWRRALDEQPPAQSASGGGRGKP